MLLDAVGHAAYISLLAGTFLIARGVRAGWGLRLAGSATWALLGVLMGYSSIVLWSSVFSVLDIYGMTKGVGRGGHE